MKSRGGVALGVVIASTLCCGGRGFHQPGVTRIQQQQRRSSAATFQTGSSSTSAGTRGRRRAGGGSLRAKPADPPSSSAAPGKDKEDEEQRKKSSGSSSGDDEKLRRRRHPRRGATGGFGRQNTLIKQAVEAWADESLDLRRFQGKRVHICKAETLPEVLSEFWSLASMMAQEKYSAMAGDRDYAAHALFVAPRCALLKDYAMMRHLDKVLDFCSGGCSDFGRTVTLQHYHPDFVLPPSQTRSSSAAAAVDDNNNGLSRFVNFSRAPYPTFGLTAAAGSLVRSEPIEKTDKIGHLRLDLELVYNSVAGRSTDDCVDSHGSPHGTIPSSPEEVQDKTLDWLYSLPPALQAGQEGAVGGVEERGAAGDEGVSTAAIVKEEEKEAGRRGSGASNGRGGSSSSLASSYEGGLVTSGLNSPEKILSEVWSIVTQLREEALPFLAAAEHEEALPSPSLHPSPPLSSSTGKATDPAASATGGAAPTGGAAAVAAVAAAVEHWTKAATKLKAGAQQDVADEEGGEGAAEAAVGAGVPAKKALASTLLVAPRLHPFNAAQFENFARTLAIALKQAPIVDRIEVEVYHPELVCDGGVIDLDRRSPYPTLLLKHCGLKDVLFEPSGNYRHVLPPLKLPLEDEDSEEGSDNEIDDPEGNSSSSSSSAPPPGPFGEVSADDAQL